ncbi:MAG: hypothetical protein IT529_21120 [Burkholderiales bacterium]|nr:hypothetical protein [Burkholderiales bacterium]
MKRTIQAVIVAALFSGVAASASDAFPGNGDPVVLPSLSTYADERAHEIARGGSLNPFPESGDVVVLAPEWTYADRNADAIALAGSMNPFPESGDPVVLPPLSTYADQFITERAMHAAAETDPAGSR